MIIILWFAHFLGGTLGNFFNKKKNLYTFILLGIIGILPDADWYFRSGLLAHRNFTHTIIPMAVIAGLFTLLVMKNFWPGFIALSTHFLLDLIDKGSVAIAPYLKVSLPFMADAAPIDQIMLDCFAGIIILLIWITYLGLKPQSKGT